MKPEEPEGRNSPMDDPAFFSALLDTLETSIHDPDLILPAYNPPSAEYSIVPVDVLEAAFRHSGWLSRRASTYRSLIRINASRQRLDSFANCGSDCFVLTNQVTHEMRLQGNRCHDRFCVPCQKERSGRIGRFLVEMIKNRPLRFVTLTMRHNETNLKSQMDRLYKCYAELRRSPFWKSCSKGGLAVLEVKLGKSGKWHPHLHLLVEGTFIDQRALGKLWHEITGDSYIVDVRDARSGEIAGYLTKYLTKPAAAGVYADPEKLDEYIIAMKGRRQLNKFGSWAGLELEAAEPDPNPDSWVIIGRLTALLNRRHYDQEAVNILKQLINLPWKGKNDPLNNLDPPLP